MTEGNIKLDLRLGRIVTLPAPLKVMQALRSVEVTRSDDGASSFQMSFNADRPDGYSMDYPVIFSPWLLTNNRVMISLIINGSTSVLMDGIITNVEFNHSHSSGSATFSVTGQDVSVHMDVTEISFPYPGMSLTMIIMKIILKYFYYGLAPLIISPKIPQIWEPLERSRIQNTTDLSYIKELGSLVGHVFRIHHISPGTNVAYFGPKINIGMPTHPLNVDMGAATNVEDVSFSNNSRQPITVQGNVQDPRLEENIPLRTFGMSPTTIPMSLLDIITTNQPYIPKQLFTDPTNDYATSMMQAQNMTDNSSAVAVSGQITLDTLRYGKVVDVPSIAMVRGAGFEYDGIYYVSSVQHSISAGKYTQNLTLSRSGVGNLLPVMP